MTSLKGFTSFIQPLCIARAVCLLIWRVMVSTYGVSSIYTETVVTM
ncbi:hypothetical protein PI124_g24336 [Phytophthora idaei]|nr:hypothetical protein PI125_g26713 [Phytophthora idaei]KAG3121845.1 hypothetical protein PI126_g24391 [Phytophthora idaei]KAG3230566.1 hypothetical protein PI124_g24336 [Phytophthora idaei]